MAQNTLYIYMYRHNVLFPILCVLDVAMFRFVRAQIVPLLWLVDMCDARVWTPHPHQETECIIIRLGWTVAVAQSVSRLNDSYSQYIFNTRICVNVAT